MLLSEARGRGPPVCLLLVCLGSICIKCLKGEAWSTSLSDEFESSTLPERNFLEAPSDLHQHRYCPPGCVRYSTDGCNSCACDADGYILSCTRRFCYSQGAPQCLKYGTETTSTSTSSVTPPVTFPPSTTIGSSLPFPQCPPDCRVFRPDGCNECFCSAAGVTLWCSEMSCSTEEMPAQVCAEHLDGRRTLTPAPASSTEAPLTTTLPPSTLPPSTSATTQAEASTSAYVGNDDNTESQLCNAQGQKTLTCPSRCSLALLGCQVCSCAADGSGVEWCSPCIERCTKLRSVCLDISGSRSNRPSQSTQNVSANISRLEIDIQISNHVNQATGSAHCTGDCEIHLQRDAGEPPRLRRHSLHAAAKESANEVATLSCSKLVDSGGVSTQRCAAVDMGCLVCNCETEKDVISNCWLKSEDPRCVTSLTMAQPRCVSDKFMEGQLTHVPLTSFLPGKDPASELLRMGPELGSTFLSKLNRRLVHSDVWLHIKRLYHKMMLSISDDELEEKESS